MFVFYAEFPMLEKKVPVLFFFFFYRKAGSQAVTLRYAILSVILPTIEVARYGVFRNGRLGRLDLYLEVVLFGK